MCMCTLVCYSVRVYCCACRLMYDWSCVSESGALKQAVDCVICSLCFIQPDYFYALLQLTDTLPSSGAEPPPLTDDSKVSVKVNSCSCCACASS